jgi:general secretion pathway protein G
MFCETRRDPRGAAPRALRTWRRHGRRRAGGFSFIEVMVVVVIIGLLAAAVTLKVVGYMDTAKVNRARSDLATMVSAIEAYCLTHGAYPANEEGLANLPLKGRTDPWGNPYEYNCPGQQGEPFEVVCCGADGREGGEGIDADIYSWQLGKEAREH